MLTESYRNSRRIGMMRRAAIALGFVLSAWLVHLEVGSLEMPELHFIMTTADVIAVGVTVVLIIGARVMPTRPLFSSQTIRRDVFTSAHGLTLSRNGAEIDVLCRKLGIAELTYFQCLSLPPLTYRKAESGLTWVSALIAELAKEESTFWEGDQIIAALVALRSNLEDAKEDGADFCLKPIGGWSLPARMLYDTEV